MFWNSDQLVQVKKMDKAYKLTSIFKKSRYQNELSLIINSL